MKGTELEEKLAFSLQQILASFLSSRMQYHAVNVSKCGVLQIYFILATRQLKLY